MARNVVFGKCPICDELTTSIGSTFSTRCRTCPFELVQRGSYAADVILDGKTYFDTEGFGDESELEAKVEEMRAIYKKKSPSD